MKHNLVDLVVDVYCYLASRACLQFNKEQMIIELRKKAVSYGKTRDLEPMLIIWQPHPLQEVSMNYFCIKYSRLAIVCAEAVPWRCHRRMIQDYLVMVEGVSVFNIFDIKKPSAPHELTSFARLIDDKIIAYPENVR
ncbi:MAG: DUF488 family protein [Nitrososphaeraceae archaeon]|nr:DUF488 family protein [Nitrososphaeraceae archaeon]